MVEPASLVYRQKTFMDSFLLRSCSQAPETPNKCAEQHQHDKRHENGRDAPCQKYQYTLAPNDTLPIPQQEAWIALLALGVACGRKLAAAAGSDVTGSAQKRISEAVDAWLGGVHLPTVFLRSHASD